jgi:HK97 family phage major capsid protein
MTTQEMQAAHDHAFSTADSIISAAERQKRPLTTHEQRTIDASLATVADLKPRIAAAKPKSTADVRAVLNDLSPRQSHLASPNIGKGEPLMPDKFSRDYLAGFYGYLGRSSPMNASLQEGVATSGGYAIPVVVDGAVVPLAPQDSAVRRLATVIPTKSDIRVPGVTVRAAVTAKSEASNFGEASQSFGQFTLSAFGAGVEVPTSFEFAQDVILFKTFTLDDAVSAFLEYEENLYINGTGSGQAQGLIGNVGAGITAEPDGLGNVVSIQATLNVLGALKATYHKNASWLMQRATSLVIRAAQVQTGLYEPVFRRENGIDLLHGYPVEYSSQMPTAARGNCAALFGDFSKSYLIGDRGGSALILKVIDQGPGAAQGMIDLLFYRRTDGRVRVIEGIQSLNIAAS